MGEAGQGHRIAFNILNVGRYKLGAAAIGGAKYAFRSGIRYAKERIAFSKPIASFGLVQQMIADSASGIYAGESLVYRVIGAIDASLADMEKSEAAKTADIQKHIEEYAIECSIVKVWCSEMLERLVDQSGAVARRIWLCGRLFRRACVSRFANQQNFRGHKRDQSADYQRMDIEARHAGKARSAARDSAGDG